MDNKEQEQDTKMEILSGFVRIGVLIWSGCILTLAYVQLPPAWGIPEQKIDATFIASVFTGCTASLGLEIGNRKKKSLSKEEIDQLVAAQQKTDKPVNKS